MKEVRDASNNQTVLWLFALHGGMNLRIPWMYV
jgi:hypothetical protein